MQYKNTHSLEKRKNEANNIIKMYPGNIPIILENKPDQNLPVLNKKKYLIPGEFTIGQFLFFIRKNMNIEKDKAVFLITNNTLPVNTSTIDNIYKIHKDDDGFLYFLLCKESVYG